VDGTKTNFSTRKLFWCKFVVLPTNRV
jgi:hypothetical protein